MSEGSVALAMDAASAVDSKWLKLGILAAGVVGLGFVVWWFVFRKETASGYRVAGSVEELVQTPITQTPPLIQNPAAGIVLTPGRSECEDLLIRFNGASRSHPDLAMDIRAEAKAKGCGWAR